METRIDEIASGVYRLSIFVPETAPPAGFTYSHFLIVGDEPLLFDCGKRKMFPLVSAAVARIMPVQRLRWLAFGHFEADECGSMNEWLAAAPAADLTHGMVGCRVSVSDMADRPQGCGRKAKRREDTLHTVSRCSELYYETGSKWPATADFCGAQSGPLNGVHRPCCRLDRKGSL